MMRKLIVCIILLTFSSQLKASDNCYYNDSLLISTKDNVDYFPLKNSIYIEFGGIANYYSINYERSLISFNKNNFSLRVAGGYLPIAMQAYTYYSFIVNYKRSLGKKVFFNSGVGFVNWKDRQFSSVGLASDQGSSTKGTYYVLTLGIEYKPVKNLLLKLSLTPKHNDELRGSSVTPVFIGTSIGLSF